MTNRSNGLAGLELFSTAAAKPQSANFVSSYKSAVFMNVEWNDLFTVSAIIQIGKAWVHCGSYRFIVQHREACVLFEVKTASFQKGRNKAHNCPLVVQKSTMEVTKTQNLKRSQDPLALWSEHSTCCSVKASPGMCSLDTAPVLRRPGSITWLFWIQILFYALLSLSGILEPMKYSQ